MGRLDTNPEYWEGLRGACIGALYSIITERDIGAPNGLTDILDLLRQSSNSQADTIIRVIIRRLGDQ